MANFDLSKLNNLSENEKAAVLKILQQYSDNGKSAEYDSLMGQDWAEIPVDIHTFLHDRNYLGNALYDAEGRFTLFPYWEKVLEDIFPTNTTVKYNTVILTGAIGIGKTLVADVCQLYMLYKLLCLRDPYLYYGLQPIDKITISFINTTLENAKGVALDKFNQTILSSPWFMSHGQMVGISNLEYHPNNHIEIVPASSNNQIVGRAVYSSFADEVDFSANTMDPEKIKKKMLSLITNVDARMTSRFLRGNFLPTLHIIASSKTSDQSFLANYINNKKEHESKSTLIIDEAQWVVDARKVTDEWFHVAIGNKFLANELIPLDATESLLEEYVAKGYSILDVPMAYHENFLDNIDQAITNIAGLSTASAMKYISGMRWNEIRVNTYENPFSAEIIESGTGDPSQYYEFFDITKVPRKLRMKPMYIHLDMSTTGDKTGIAGVWAVGKLPKVEGESSSKEMFYQLAFSVSIKAPKGHQISFDKHRTFIRWLRKNGFNIKGISSDTFQSGQLQQQLNADGFNASIISVDRLDAESKQCLPYAYLKATIYDKRFLVYKEGSKFLTEEVVGLERQTDGHINHPEGGTKGSKDAIDAVCGAMWNASLHADEYAYEFGEAAEMLADFNLDNDSVDFLNEEFENAFMEHYRVSHNIGNNNTSIDFGFGPAVDMTELTSIDQGIMYW